MGGRPATHPAARDLFALPRRRRQARWCVRPTCSCPTPTSVVAPLGRALAHARLRRGECRHGRWPFTPSCPLRRRTRRLEPTPPPRPPVSCWTTRGRLARRTHHAHGTRGTYVIVFGVVSFRYPPVCSVYVYVLTRRRAERPACAHRHGIFAPQGSLGPPPPPFVVPWCSVLCTYEYAS